MVITVDFPYVPLRSRCGIWSPPCVPVSGVSHAISLQCSAAFCACRAYCQELGADNGASAMDGAASNCHQWYRDEQWSVVDKV